MTDNRPASFVFTYFTDKSSRINIGSILNLILSSDSDKCSFHLTWIQLIMHFTWRRENCKNCPFSNIYGPDWNRNSWTFHNVRSRHKPLTRGMLFTNEWNIVIICKLLWYKHNNTFQTKLLYEYKTLWGGNRHPVHLIPVFHIIAPTVSSLALLRKGDTFFDYVV